MGLMPSSLGPPAETHPDPGPYGWKTCRCTARGGDVRWVTGPGALPAHLMRMMTEGVWAIAPIMLQTHITHRKVRKASWQPGLGHLPGTTVAFSGGPFVRHAQPVRF